MSIDIKPDDFALTQAQIGKFKQIEEDRVLEGKEAWPLYDSPLSSYDESFKDVTPKGGIRRILTELLTEKDLKELSVLDVAGQGTPFLECAGYGVNNITALSLGDYRGQERKISETAHGLEYVVGDVFDKTIRERIVRNKYNLVSFRASGGRDIASSPEKGMDLLSFMYSVLDENGIVLMEVPENIPIQLGTKWVNELAATSGIEISFSSPKRNRQSYLLLRKKIGGPKEIETILRQSPKSPEHAFRINTLTWK